MVPRTGYIKYTLWKIPINFPQRNQDKNPTFDHGFAFAPQHWTIETSCPPGESLRIHRPDQARPYFPLARAKPFGAIPFRGA